MVKTDTTEHWKKEFLIDTLNATITSMKKEDFLLPEIVNLVTREFMGWDKSKGDPK